MVCHLYFFFILSIYLFLYFLYTYLFYILGTLAKYHIQRTVQNFLRPTQKYAIQRAIRKVFV